MAALSYHSNWETFDHQHELNSDMNMILSHPDHLFNNYTQFSDNFLNLDHLFEPNDVVLHPQNYDNDIHSNIYSDMINELLQENHSPEPIIPTLPYFSTAMAAPETGRSLSAQSVAARQRRRRISEKTQQLGKLVPGGMKMNTAEMLNAAYKYVKYLQAQIGILEFMTSYHHEGINGDLFQSVELEGFLESPLIQEKLYSMEKCLVPEKLMQELAANDRD